ncbi:immunity 53 family protein [Hypericibacter sp.]|uniref:immunity 53 family protein n=1 Tax=Hypericibacter sp. TaxID=2705401 RepID=UPI003D6D4104
MSTQGDNLDWLQSWYATQCNGVWEHSWGIKIGNIDNPGWTIDIDIRDTKLEGERLSAIDINRSEGDWYHVACNGQKFHGVGGAKNLGDILQVFKEFVEGH